MANPNISDDQFGAYKPAIEDMGKYKTVAHVEEEISLSRNNYQGGAENLAPHMRRLNALHNRRQSLMGLKGAHLTNW